MTSESAPQHPCIALFQRRDKGETTGYSSSKSRSRFCFKVNWETSTFRRLLSSPALVTLVLIYILYLTASSPTPKVDNDAYEDVFVAPSKHDAGGVSSDDATTLRPTSIMEPELNQELLHSPLKKVVDFDDNLLYDQKTFEENNDESVDDYPAQDAPIKDLASGSESSLKQDPLDILTNSNVISKHIVKTSAPDEAKELANEQKDLTLPMSSSKTQLGGAFDRVKSQRPLTNDEREQFNESVDDYSAQSGSAQSQVVPSGSAPVAANDKKSDQIKVSSERMDRRIEVLTGQDAALPVGSEMKNDIILEEEEECEEEEELQVSSKEPTRLIAEVDETEKKAESVTVASSADSTKLHPNTKASSLRQPEQVLQDDPLKTQDELEEDSSSTSIKMSATAARPRRIRKLQ